MTREQTERLLSDISVLYPNVGRNEKTRGRFFELWCEALAEEDYEEAHRGLIRFYKTDRRGYFPTIGQMLDREPEEDEEMDVIHNKASENDWDGFNSGRGTLHVMDPETGEIIL